MKVIFSYTRICTVDLDSTAITLDELIELCSSYPELLHESIYFEEELQNHAAVENVSNEPAGIGMINIFDDDEVGGRLLATITPV